MFLGAQGETNRTSRCWEYSQYILLAVHIPEVLPVLQSIRVVPSKSNLLQLPLVGPSVSDLGLRIVDTVHWRSKHTYSKYHWAYWEYFGTASTRSMNTIITDGRNTYYCKYTCRTRISTEPRDTWSTRSICAAQTRNTACARSIYSSVFSGILCFGPKYWEQLWKVEVVYACHT